MLDGHTRHEICGNLGLKFRTVTADVTDRDSARLFIEENQMGRRNLTDDQRAVIAESAAERRSKAAKHERAQNAGEIGGKVGGRGRTKKKIGLSVNVTDKPIPKKDTRTQTAKEAKVPERKLRQRPIFLAEPP